MNHRTSRKRQEKARRRRVKIAREQLAERQRRIQERLKRQAAERDGPIFAARSIRFELSLRTGVICYGGIGLMHSLARECGLIDAIDAHVELLKFHLPYHESDHVLNIAYNALTDGRCLEDIELKRNDEKFVSGHELCGQSKPESGRSGPPRPSTAAKLRK